MNTLVPWSAYGLLLTTTKEISYFALFLLFFKQKFSVIQAQMLAWLRKPVKFGHESATDLQQTVTGEGALWWRWTKFIRQNPPGFCSSAYCTLVVIDGITLLRGRARCNSASENFHSFIIFHKYPCHNLEIAQQK